MVKTEDTRSSTQGEGPVSQGFLPPGSFAGDYVVTDLIARGGCGSVYRAVHRTDGRIAAVKVLHASLAVLPKMVERFAREVHVVELLQHPSIVAVYDVGSLSDGRPYYVMEYLEGRTVARILDEEGRLSPAEALAILAPVCDALDAAHAAGVVHRDVKASNIIVSPHDPPVVKLVDFGIAKLIGHAAGATGLTTVGRQVGTLTIMAPEQLLGSPVDARIDIYALGILLFRMLTGRLPFAAKDALTLAQQHLEEPAPRPSQRTPLPPALDAIVLRCLEKQPDRRYDTVRDFLSAFRGAVSGASTRRDSAPYAYTPGVAVYVEIRMGTQRDEVDESLSDDVGGILDTAEDELRAGGFILASATGSDLLGVLPLSADPERARRERKTALALAATLRRQIDGRPDADERVRVNVCVHAGEVVLRGVSRPEVVGGTLVRTDSWVPREEVSALCATREAIEGVTGVDLATGPGALVTIAVRTEGLASGPA
ncbi:serine/threonine protein kinase [Minicystis rosea]|nr:serine/threonine protein kinase [Minicystis rosea]